MAVDSVEAGLAVVCVRRLMRHVYAKVEECYVDGLEYRIIERLATVKPCCPLMYVHIYGPPSVLPTISSLFLCPGPPLSPPLPHSLACQSRSWQSHTHANVNGVVKDGLASQTNGCVAQRKT